MGEKLLAFYEKAKQKGGIGAQIKLATITKMSSAAAAKAEDSTENIKIFQEAMKQI